MSRSTVLPEDSAPPRRGFSLPALNFLRRENKKSPAGERGSSNLDVAAVCPAQRLKSLLKRCHSRLSFPIVGHSHQHADPPHPLRLLCARRERPSGRTAEQRYERAPFSLDHLVGEREQPVRNLEAERLRRLEVDHQLELGWLQHGKISGLSTFQNPADINAGLTVRVD
jgi:hypothetical protein